MSENFIRHLISLAGTLICLFAFLGGYVSGQHGWWWAIVTTFIMYIVIYKLVES